VTFVIAVDKWFVEVWIGQQSFSQNDAFRCIKGLLFDFSSLPFGSLVPENEYI